MLSKKSLLLLAGASALWIVLLIWLLDSVSQSPALEVGDLKTTGQQAVPVNEFAVEVNTENTVGPVASTPADAVADIPAAEEEIVNSGLTNKLPTTDAVSTESVTDETEEKEPLAGNKPGKPVEPVVSVTSDTASITASEPSVALAAESASDTPAEKLSEPETVASVSQSIEETIRKKLTNKTAAPATPALETEAKQSSAQEVSAQPVLAVEPVVADQSDNSSKLVAMDIASVDQGLLDELMALGKEEYAIFCAACHGEEGKGIGAFPPIAGSSVVTGDADRHVNVVFSGVDGTGMRAFAEKLNDKSMAAVITYQRNAFGNETGDVVTPALIEALR